MIFTEEERKKLERYLRSKFANGNITIKQRAKTNDSVEVMIGTEFIGVIYKDAEDPDDVSFDFNMPILEMDLNAA